MNYKKEISAVDFPHPINRFSVENIRFITESTGDLIVCIISELVRLLQDDGTMPQYRRIVGIVSILFNFKCTLPISNDEIYRIKVVNYIILPL